MAGTGSNSAARRDTVTFFLNGRKVTLDKPSPDLLLIDYLRGREVGLAGPKKPCGQGGCGSCTVVLSHWDEVSEIAVHRAINSCLRPVAALEGLAVTTIEGTGSVDGVMNPVAYRLAANNGTQCGYCTNGWVMAMTGFLANRPERRTKKDIEDLFDGNLCRCTGYRSILTGMKTFASDWSPEDEAERMICEIDATFDAKSVASEVEIPFPEGAKHPAPPVSLDAGGKSWIAVDSIDDLLDVIRLRGTTRHLRLIHGNTSIGIYRDEVEAATTYVDIRAIPDLHGIERGPNRLTVGAGTAYSDLITFLEAEPDLEENGKLAALHHMARRTAGTLVRNAASLAGNTMLMLKHIHRDEPFASDMATAFRGLGAIVDFFRLSSGETTSLELSALMEACVDDPLLADDLLLLRYHLPLAEDGAICLAQKVALREVNSHSIVNATTLFFVTPPAGGETCPVFGACHLVFGGIAPYAWSAVETAAFLKGRPADFTVLQEAIDLLGDEVDRQLERWAARLAALKDEGFSNNYRRELAQTYLFKAFVNALLRVAPNQVPPAIASAGKITWGTWPVSDGRQRYQTDLYAAPLSKPYVKLMAMYQAQGEVRYTHEIPATSSALFGALVQSPVALGRYRFKHPETSAPLTPSELQAWLLANKTGSIDLVTAEDIPPGGKHLQGMGNDQPIFADDTLVYEGQVIALVLAESQMDAERLARFIEQQALDILPDAEGKSPTLSIEDAIAGDQIFPDCPKSAPFVTHIWKVTRAGSDLSWVRDRSPLDQPLMATEIPFGDGSCRLVESNQAVGAQLHFYMETQSAVAEPEDGNGMRIHPSTQSPKAVHDAVCAVLDVPQNQVGIDVRQVGGAYGGKTESSRFVPAAAAIACNKTRRPVHLLLDRESDSAFNGRRHPVLGQYQLAVETGDRRPEDKGLIRGLMGRFFSDGGAFYDCSMVVADCIQLRVDSAYYVPNYQTEFDVCRTNKAPNTAYRTFGDIQGTLILENAIEDAAVALGMDPAKLREKNLYQRGQSTPGGQGLPYCYLREVWDYAKEISDFDDRQRAVARFNEKNRWRKRGLCLMPLKYGSGYNLVLLEQTSAMVNIYASDGTILIRQGGVDMGQGMLTKIVQIAAYELNVPMEIIRIESSDTRVTPSPTSTGASTGTQYNGEAVRQSCAVLRDRLHAFGQEMLRLHGAEWCRNQGINYWDFGTEGWRKVIGGGNKPATIWQKIVALAFQNRVNLQAQVDAKIPGGTGIVPNVAFKPRDLQPTGTGIPIDPNGAFSEVANTYVGFTYSAAAVEVEVDILTGEKKVLRADIVYDMGKSLNPAIDIGQVEGAFVQGLGYVLTEQMVFQPDGPEIGRLNTVNTWRYKPPAITTIPLEMNVHLFPRERAEHVPEDPNTLFSSKEVGEPPMVLANAAFFAVKSAIRASRVERNLDPLFPMNAPATVQEVRRATAIDRGDLGCSVSRGH